MSNQHTISRSLLKESAKAAGVKISDLCALSVQNDPFAMGSPAQVESAQWFKKHWVALGYDGQTGIHIRQMHYELQATGTVPLPTRVGWTDPDSRRKEYTDTYINVEACWLYLVRASKAARYLGYVEASAFVDRRNPDAVVFDKVPDKDEYGYEDPKPGWSVTGGWSTKTDPDETWWEDDNERFGLPELPTLTDLPDRLPNNPRLEAKGYTGTPQKYVIECWVEKSTMNKVILPICEKYKVNLVYGAGELSITSVVEYLERIAAHGRPGRILYISDFDPAGIGMPISISRKIEFFLSLLAEEGREADIALKPIVLNQEQIAHYNLPGAPVKSSDRRKANFERDHDLAVELDALEALHKGELAKIIEDEILKYYDQSYHHDLWDAKSKLQARLSAEASRLVEGYNSDGVLTGLGQHYADVYDEWQQIRAEFDDLVAGFDDRIKDIQYSLDDVTSRTNVAHDEIRDLYRQITVKLTDEPQAEADEGVIHAPNIPTPKLPHEDADDLLYASFRDYMEQLIEYKKHRHGA